MFRFLNRYFYYIRQLFMLVTCYPYSLQFTHPFRLAHGTRTHTPCVYVKLQSEGLTAWGEATLPPYLPETQQSVIRFVQSFVRKMDGQNPSDWLATLNNTETDMSARAALDMALWSLRAQQERTTVGALVGIEQRHFPLATFTLGGGDVEEMKTKIAYAEAQGFQLFKLKLDGKQDQALVHRFKSLTDTPFAVDVNQGWTSVAVADRMIYFLNEQGCLLVEQPLPKDMLSDMPTLKANSPLPLFADESVQRLTDLEAIAAGFHGVNIKLMKCGGLSEGLLMVAKAKALGLKLLIGCMSESSVGCLVAAPLAPLADYADLDGPFLIANDLFEGMTVVNGRLAPKHLQLNSSGTSYFVQAEGFEC